MDEFLGICFIRSVFLVSPTKISQTTTETRAWKSGLMIVSESLAIDKKVTPDLIWKPQCLASNVGQFRIALTIGKTIMILQHYYS